MKATPRTAQSIARSIADYKMKPHIFPPDMVILQDTREQCGLFTGRLPKGCTVRSEKLDNGDYSLLGHTTTFAIERKGISDLLSYITSERDRTLAKMKRFAKMEFVALVVEVPRESELYRPYLFSAISPELVRQCLISFQIRYGIHVYVGNRENITRNCLDWMIKYHKVKREL